MSAILVHLKNHHTRSGSYNDPWGGAIFDPRGMIGRIYVELHIKLLHIKYTSFVSSGCREEDFFMYFLYTSKLVDNDMPGVWPVWTPNYNVHVSAYAKTKAQIRFPVTDVFGYLISIWDVKYC